MLTTAILFQIVTAMVGYLIFLAQFQAEESPGGAAANNSSSHNASSQI